MEEEGKMYLSSSMVEVVYNEESGDGQKSEYEKMIEKNCAEKIEFLQSLNLDEAKSALMESVVTVPRKFCKRDYATLVGYRSKSKRRPQTGNLSEKALQIKVYEEAKLAAAKEKQNENSSNVYSKKKKYKMTKNENSSNVYSKQKKYKMTKKQAIKGLSCHGNWQLYMQALNTHNGTGGTKTIYNSTTQKQKAKKKTEKDPDYVIKNVKSSAANVNDPDYVIKNVKSSAANVNGHNTGKPGTSFDTLNEYLGIGKITSVYSLSDKQNPMVTKHTEKELPDISIIKEIPKACSLQNNVPLTTKKGTTTTPTVIKNAVAKKNGMLLLLPPQTVPPTMVPENVCNKTPTGLTQKLPLSKEKVPLTTKKGTTTTPAVIKNAVANKNGILLLLGPQIVPPTMVPENVCNKTPTGLTQKLPLSKKKATPNNPDQGQKNGSFSPAGVTSQLEDSPLLWKSHNFPGISITKLPNTSSLQDKEPSVTAECSDSNLPDIVILEPNEPMAPKMGAPIGTTETRTTVTKENVSAKKSTGLKRKLVTSIEMDNSAKESEKYRTIRQEGTKVVNDTITNHEVNKRIRQEEGTKVVNDTVTNHEVNKKIRQDEKDKMVKTINTYQELMIEQLKELNSNFKIAVNVLQRLDEKSDQIIALLKK